MYLLTYVQASALPNATYDSFSGDERGPEKLYTSFVCSFVCCCCQMSFDDTHSDRHRYISCRIWKYSNICRSTYQWHRKSQMLCFLVTRDNLCTWNLYWCWSWFYARLWILKQNHYVCKSLAGMFVREITLRGNYFSLQLHLPRQIM